MATIRSQSLLPPPKMADLVSQTANAKAAFVDIPIDPQPESNLGDIIGMNRIKKARGI